MCQDWGWGHKDEWDIFMWGEREKLSHCTCFRLNSWCTIHTDLWKWQQCKHNNFLSHFLLQRMKVKSESEVVQSCLTLIDPMDCSPPGSSVHGIFQARVLEWGAIAFSALIALEVSNFLYKFISIWDTYSDLWFIDWILKVTVTIILNGVGWLVSRVSRKPLKRRQWQVRHE